jgi:hypothetical protein
MHQLFKTKMTKEEERKSIIPFEYLFMSQDGLKNLLEKTKPADEEIKVTVTPLENIENKNITDIQV